ncbi:DUF1842 domain-containing protein [Sorangium sp. So ce134]
MDRSSIGSTKYQHEREIIMNETTSDTGVFLLKLDIGSGAPGAQRFQIALGVNAVDKRIGGEGRITKSVNPPLDVRTELSGSFTYMTVMPKNTHVLVVAAGYPAVHMPPLVGPGPVLMPNAQLRMVLDATWSTGTASYSYQDASGKWVEVEDVPVRADRSSL